MLPKKIKGLNKVRVFIDYANLKSSALHLGMHTDLKILYEYLSSIQYIDKVSLYYGTDPRNGESYKFIEWLKNTGYDVVTKDVKYIKVDIKDLVTTGKNKRLLEKLDKDVVKKFLLEVEKLNPRIDFLESPKCNFDIEIALDMFQSMQKYDGFILFSGDGDFAKVVQLARAEGKYVIVITLRKFLAGELVKSADKYINLAVFENLKGFLFKPTKNAKK
jgi:uncharacterized LabA/DUF88 family protein